MKLFTKFFMAWKNSTYSSSQVIYGTEWFPLLNILLGRLTGVGGGGLNNLLVICSIT